MATGTSPLGAAEPRRQGINRVRTGSLLLWAALLVMATWICFATFSRTYHYSPGASWSTSRDEAIALVKERLYDLGEPPPSPYITAVLQSNEALELRLLAAGIPRTDVGQDRSGDSDSEDASSESGERGLGRSADRLEQRLSSWLVTIYDRGASPSEWAYRAEVALDGTFLTLLQGVPANFRSPVQLTFEDAVSRADIFLGEAGFELGDYYDPIERRVEVAEFTYQLLRYEKRRPPSTRQRVLSSPGDESDLSSSSVSDFSVSDDGAHGMEVRFAGNELMGFMAWVDPSLTSEFAEDVRGSSQVRLGQLLVPFLLLPLVGVVFVRRYHQGLVGAKRGTQVFLGVLLCSIVVVLFTARGASEGTDFGDFSRQSVTLGWVSMLLLIYLPALSLFAGLSCAVGESIAHGTWRSRWATWDALLHGRWNNATVAASSLRGLASGFTLLGLLQLASIALSREGFFSPFGLLFGPWWPSAPLPGVILLLLQISLVTASTAFGLLFLMPLLAARLGMLLAWAVTGLLMALLSFSPILTAPALAGFPLALLFQLAVVLIFVRYGFASAWLATLITAVGPGAMVLLATDSRSLQAQGLAVLLACGAPLWVSLGSVLSTRHYRYEYDDVPPHVRRIAERERQRVELLTAKGIQSSILPDLPNQLGGVEIAHTYLPASEVGGDFYDAIELRDGRLAVAIGDVAGHGVSSGLIMSMVRSALAVQVQFEPAVGAVVSALNGVVYKSARRRLLTTLCYALLDPATRRLTFASAGHLYPYRIDASGAVSTLESTAYPLGVRENLTLECRETMLLPGDAIFLASDGLVEARRYGGDEMFGFERLEASLRRCPGATAQELQACVLEDLEFFVSSGHTWAADAVSRDDDMTILVLRLPAA